MTMQPVSPLPPETMVPPAAPRSFAVSQQLQPRFNRVIPGGAHTYAKGDDQFPEGMAPYLVRGQGCRVWDADGNQYIEYGMGLRSVTLGHVCPSVVAAAGDQLQHGVNFGRPATIELACAEQFLELTGAGDMVKFGKHGSDATTGAITLARAHTGRDLIAVCGNQPFFSVESWFIGTTGMPGGIPQAIRDLTVKFDYNDLDSARRLFAQYPNQIAGLILEAERDVPPQPGFLTQLRDLCHAHGALFILDEIVTGFRWHVGGAQRVYDVVPDLSTFGKAMGNGFAVAALTGKREFMQLGGTDHDRERVFLLSTTNGAESHALAAAMATMRIYQTNRVVEYLYRQGARLASGVRQSIAEHGLEGYFSVFGRDCCLFYGTRDQNQQPSQPFRTLFLQEILRRGVMAPSFIVSYSHTDADIDQTTDIIHAALGVYRQALDEGIDKYLIGRSVQPVFRKYR